MKFTAALLVLLPIVQNCAKSPTESNNIYETPLIMELSATLKNVAVGGRCEVSCVANDGDGDHLEYFWEATQGEIKGVGATGIWTAPLEPVTATISVTVDDGKGGKQFGSIKIATHRNSPTRILVDASHDGGVWWFPQVHPFNSNAPHQGKALADYLRQKGFQVTELSSWVTISDSVLNSYDKVIRAGNYGIYREAELKAYDNFLSRNTRLLFISEYLRSQQKDPLAERLGLAFRGIAKGNVTKFAQHPITTGARPFFYNAGSVLLDVASNPNIEPLGWLVNNVYVDLNDNDTRDSDEPTGMPVLGILHHATCRIFFIGEINGLQVVPQPLVENLIDWLFVN